MKIVPADVGPIEVKGPRDTAGVFEPQMVKRAAAAAPDLP
ncbi:hypothetical protein STENM327S_03026 [Streptomyces tendae]